MEEQQQQQRLLEQKLYLLRFVYQQGSGGCGDYVNRIFAEYLVNKRDIIPDIIECTRYLVRNKREMKAFLIFFF